MINLDISPLTISDDLTLNIMIYGRRGAGKTELAGTACLHPKMQKVLLIDAEGGSLTIADAKYANPPLVVKARNANHMEEIFFALSSGGDERLAGVRTVIVDSASDMSSVDLEATVRSKIEKERTKNPRTKHEHVDDIHIGDRGESVSRMTRIIRYFRDLDVNLILTAHERVIYPKRADDKIPDESARPKAVYPDFGASLRRNLEGFMDIVCYVHVEPDGTRVVYFQQTGPVFAKTRGSKISEALGRACLWPQGEPLMAAIYECVRTQKPINSKYRINAENVSASDTEQGE